MMFCLIRRYVFFSREMHVNDTHWVKCVLLNSVQEFIEIEARLLLTFLLC